MTPHAATGPATAQSLRVFGGLVMVQRASVFLAPSLLMGLVNVPIGSTEGEGYLRLLGVAMVVIGYFYRVCSDSERFARATVLDRPLAFLAIVGLAAAGKIDPRLSAFALQDLVFAGITYAAMRRDARSVDDAPLAVTAS